jgi:hypothetical protein
LKQRLKRNHLLQHSQQKRILHRQSKVNIKEIKFNSFYHVNFTCNIEDKKKSVEKVEKKKKGNKANISTASEAPVKGIISYSTLFLLYLIDLFSS